MDDRRAGTFRKPRPGLRSALCIPAGLAVLAALAGCFTEPERSSGVDDFPNSIYASVAGFLDENDRAGDLGAAPPADSLLIRARVGTPALPKAGAAALASLPGLAKPAFPGAPAAAAPAGACAGYFTLSGTKVAGTRVTLDSLIYCVDAAWLDTVKGNEHIARMKSVTRDTVSGRVETGEISDGDGDGIVNPVPGAESRMAVRFLVADGGVIEETRAVVGGGPDDDFNTSGNNPTYELSWSKTAAAGGAVLGGHTLAAGDTLASASFADADSDGVAIDPLRPCLVDVAWFARGPTEDDPDAAWSRFRMRTMSYYGKVQTSYPSRFHAESETRGGRLNRIRLLNLQGGEDVAGGDTVLARFRVEGTAPSDTLDTLETTLRMRIGDFGDKQDDSVFALHVRVAKKLGEERSASFDFLSDAPILHGQDPVSGALSMRAGYADGTALDVEGALTAGTLDVTATLRDGKRIHAVWDRAGKGISLEVLD